jgi:hypothetical protein
MIQRFARDESGMTMALAIMMILLIGVMGAGLLTFVMNDTKSVLEANKGQRALDIADAGIQAAKAHLRDDSFQEHYDTTLGNDCNQGWRVGNENWSKEIHIYPEEDGGSCEGVAVEREDDAATPWREDEGITSCFPDTDDEFPDTDCDTGGRFHVTIECYDDQRDIPDDPDPANNACEGGVTGPPPEDVPATEKKFFKITSTGYDTEAGDGAIRKIEAIYFTSQNTYVPLAYWTPSNINFNGTTCVKRMSFFAGGNITGVKKAGGPNAGCNGAASSPQGIVADRSQPALYRDWLNAPYNTTPRVDASGNPIISAGFGAVGYVCSGSPGNQCDGPEDSYADGYHDYDRTTRDNLPWPDKDIMFMPEPSIPDPNQPANEITFPFEEGNALTTPSEIVDPGLLEEMAAAAGDQGTYFGAEGNYPINDWPADPGQDVRYFVDGTQGDGVEVTFNVDSCQGNCDPGEPIARGIIIVDNGEFSFSSSSDPFQGVIIVIGTGEPDSGGVSNSGTYKQAGSGQLDGYAASSGDMTINGSVEPNTTLDALATVNSFTAVTLWSWRELYE